MRRAQKRAGRRSPAVIMSLLALVLAPSVVRAQESERFNLSAFGGYAAERFHSLGADTVGLSSNTSPDGGLLIDFRVIDLPMGKTAAKPSLHLTGGISTTSRILGPPLEGMEVGVFKVLDLAGGVMLDLPFDALLKGNTGVSLRLGFDGGYLLTRTSDTNFLTQSKFRADFVRTGGPMAGSLIGIGMGVDETYGFGASSKRSDVHASLQGALLRGAPVVPPAPPAKPGAKPVPPRAAVPGPRLIWAFLDVLVDTDGGTGADGMRARAGLGFDVSAFATAMFAPRH